MFRLEYRPELPVYFSKYTDCTEFIIDHHYTDIQDMFYCEPSGNTFHINNIGALPMSCSTHVRYSIFLELEGIVEIAGDEEMYRVRLWEPIAGCFLNSLSSMEPVLYIDMVTSQLHPDEYELSKAFISEKFLYSPAAISFRSSFLKWKLSN